MATAFSRERRVSRQQDCPQQHCVCCQCHCSNTRRNSDTKRPSSAVGWSQPQSSVVSLARVRPATAIGWEDKRDVGRRSKGSELERLVIEEEEEEESDRRRVMGGEHSTIVSSAGNSNSSRVSGEVLYEK